MSDTVNYYANPADIPSGTLVGLFLDAVERMGDRDAYNVTGEGAAPSPTHRCATRPGGAPRRWRARG